MRRFYTTTERSQDLARSSIGLKSPSLNRQMKVSEPRVTQKFVQGDTAEVTLDAVLLPDSVRVSLGDDSDRFDSNLCRGKRKCYS